MMDSALRILTEASSTDDEKMGALVGLHTSVHVRDAYYAPRLVPALAKLLYVDPSESVREESKRRLRVQTLGLIKIMIDTSTNEACFAPLHEFCVHLLEKSHEETWNNALKILVMIYTRASSPMLRTCVTPVQIRGGSRFRRLLVW